MFYYYPIAFEIIYTVSAFIGREEWLSIVCCLDIICRYIKGPSFGWNKIKVLCWIIITVIS